MELACVSKGAEIGTVFHVIELNERRSRRKVGTRSMRFYPRRMKGIEGGV